MRARGLAQEDPLPNEELYINLVALELVAKKNSFSAGMHFWRYAVCCSKVKGERAIPSA